MDRCDCPVVPVSAPSVQIKRWWIRHEAVARESELDWALRSKDWALPWREIDQSFSAWPDLSGGFILFDGSSVLVAAAAHSEVVLLQWRSQDDNWLLPCVYSPKLLPVLRVADIAPACPGIFWLELDGDSRFDVGWFPLPFAVIEPKGLWQRRSFQLPESSQLQTAEVHPRKYFPGSHSSLSGRVLCC